MWKVLLVEDETFVRESVKEIIRWEEMGFTLAGEAGNGEEALEMIRIDPPDLVLCDIVMPKMDGLTLLKETRKAGIGSKFVMLTCMGDFESMRQAMEFGASNYVLKLSMSVKDLRETLTKISAELTAAKPPSNRLALESAQIQPAQPVSAREKITHPEVKKMIQYIDDHYQEEITLTSLARHVTMGENYVSALFKKKTGETLIHYLHRIRIEKAIEFLRTTDWPVSSVGQQVGFMNDNYFIKIFKRFTGTTPSQYRMSR
ncbi:YesN/AraC family two-component response regulator [Paenibacillus phyllosphaerae]|uniref:YesN/AraC family two-component response regulator n=1 Tax=Paenibacillus phyllosphaerae TaxID=274593 RepID=A0A7W5FQB6_9BACL|nr:response regulator [Paenibacillus phyllosphaerae]MBB3113305.1 YesN/AraC family two-component response regulator [Paenibacillus phyllosphaerae]